MILYRITSRAYARDLSGTGAMLYGGRWNSRGMRMLYTSQSVSLAMLETLANLSSDHFQRNLVLVRLELPDALGFYEPPQLPESWRSFPYTRHTMKMGAEFLQSNFLAMRVPSAIVPMEYNFLLNPLHDAFDQVKYIDSNPILLDKRLLR